MIAKAKHLFHELHSWPVSVTWPDGYEEKDGHVDLLYIFRDGHTEKVCLHFHQRKACLVRYFGIVAFHFGKIKGRYADSIIKLIVMPLEKHAYGFGVSLPADIWRLIFGFYGTGKETNDLFPGSDFDEFISTWKMSTHYCNDMTTFSAAALGHINVD